MKTNLEIIAAINKIQADAIRYEFAEKKANAKFKRDSRLDKWAKKVKCRDDNKCVTCGSNERLHSHHIKGKAKFPELKYQEDNGITLCADCHADIHGGNLANGIRNFRLVA